MAGSNALRVRVLVGGVLLAWAGGSLAASDDAPPADPIEVTMAAIEETGSALVRGVFALAAELPPGRAGAGGASSIPADWQVGPECAVWVNAIPASPAELAAMLPADRQGDDLLELLERFRLDGWGNPLEIYMDSVDLPKRPRLVIRSAGANGTFEGPRYEEGEFEVGVAEDDIVWAFGDYCRLPGEPAADPRYVPDRHGSLEGKQARTVADLRNLGTAILSWVTDTCCGDSPSAEGERLAWPSGPCAGSVSGGEDAAGAWVPPVGERLEYEELVSLLRPSEKLRYMDAIPEFDAWGSPYEVYLRRDDLLAERIVMIRSAGADGVFDGDCYTPGHFDPADEGTDIVWGDGFFVQWPQRPGEAPR